MKKIALALIAAVALLVGCASTPSEPLATTIAEGTTNLGDRWSVVKASPDFGGAIVYNITNENYTYSFSIAKQTIDGNTVFPCVIIEQKGEVYSEDRWDTYEFNVGGELISLNDTIVHVLQGDKKGLAITGQVFEQDIEKMATADFVDVMLSNYGDSSINIINTLPIEYQTELLNL